MSSLGEVDPIQQTILIGGGCRIDSGVGKILLNGLIRCSESPIRACTLDQRRNIGLMKGDILAERLLLNLLQVFCQATDDLAKQCQSLRGCETQLSLCG